MANLSQGRTPGWKPFIKTSIYRRPKCIKCECRTYYLLLNKVVLPSITHESGKFPLKWLVSISIYNSMEIEEFTSQNKLIPVGQGFK